MVVGKEFTIL